MKLKVYSLAISLTIVFSSCWKDDEAYILPAGGGDAIQQEVALGENYDKMAYYNINERKFIVRNLADWDIAFQAGINNWHITINGGKGLLVHKTNITDFTQPYAIQTGIEWNYDVPSGNLDSTAFGEWWSDANGTSQKFVYVVDMGISYTLGARYKKLQVEKADNTGFWIKTADLNDNTTIKSHFIPKDAKRNFAHFDITTNEVKTTLEPENNTWDVLFTRYTHIFYDQGPIPLPYQVTGLLLNPNGVVAFEEQTKKFDDIDLNYALSLTFTKDVDVIGYDWKSYDQNTGKYTVDNTRTYIVKTVSGYYYKIRFIDFLSSTGVKGNPVFDIQRL